MTDNRRSKSVACRGGGLALVVAFGVTLGSCSSPAPVTAPATRSTSGALSASATPPASDTITLVTGDRVTLVTTGGRAAPRIERGPGRDRIGFSIEERGGEITVLPEDVIGLVGSRRLDPALFNVTRLLAEGYGDDRRDDVPLIVTGQPDLPATRSAMATTGVTVVRTLPGVRAMVVRQRKSSAGAALAILGAPAAGALAASPGAGPRIWLDRHRKLLLDHSVPQIGAPAAYARGLTGAGVAVAVLDTGIDATHPDLAGKVAAADSFVDDGLGTIDVLGHGTHVASIVAGTGAASAGQFHGVAPGATLLDGRVCDASGQCFDSAILAGLEWAVVTQHARIVNLSLGATDTVELDPLEDAVNQLSAQFGALFVIAAGNDGFGPGTIDSPGSADAALTVGAVDRDDERAFFSGLGPRAGDHAIKPDIMAPGVDITAARAAGTLLGPAVGDAYVQLSGTSMAAPHVAGAAALLLQQHPDWTGAQLKAALMGAAQPNPALTVYDQGAGRVDVDRVTRQSLTAEPANLNLGAASFPHDDDPPITRTVRYHNAGTEPVVLALDAALATDGTAAPPGMIAVASPTITVPAGGTADAVITVDTRVGIDRVYGGTVIATGDGVRVIVPIGVEREFESHDLTVSVIGLDGQPTAKLVSLRGVGEPGDPLREVRVSSFVSGRATFHVRRGTYAIDAISFVDGTWLMAPRFELAADASLVLDARIARPVEVAFPGPDRSFASGTWGVADVAQDFTGAALSVTPLATAEVGPGAAPGAFRSSVVVAFASNTERPAEIFYLAHLERDHFLTGWVQAVRRDDFATVVASYAGGDGDRFTKFVAPTLPSGILSVDGLSHTGPARRTEHYYFGLGARWHADVAQQPPGSATPVRSEDGIREYRPGRRYVESWNQAPFGPAFGGPELQGMSEGTGAPMREDDILVLTPLLFASQGAPARNHVPRLMRGRVTLLRDGQIISETRNPRVFGLAPRVAPEPAQYRLEADLTRPSDVFELSPHVSAAWTFRSQHVDGAQPLPLPTLRFFPPLDEHNQAALRVLPLPIVIERPAGARAPRIAHAHVEVSFDDGATWTPVPILRLDDRALGLVVHPPGATHVSLRGAADDVDGNAVEQTIIRAYALARR